MKMIFCEQNDLFHYKNIPSCSQMQRMGKILPLSRDKNPFHITSKPRKLLICTIYMISTWLSFLNSNITKKFPFLFFLNSSYIGQLRTVLIQWNIIIENICIFVYNAFIIFSKNVYHFNILCTYTYVHKLCFSEKNCISNFYLDKDSYS